MRHPQRRAHDHADRLSKIASDLWDRRSHCDAIDAATGQRPTHYHRGLARPSSIGAALISASISETSNGVRCGALRRPRRHRGHAGADHAQDRGPLALDSLGIEQGTL